MTGRSQGHFGTRPTRSLTNSPVVATTSQASDQTQAIDGIGASFCPAGTAPGSRPRSRRAWCPCRPRWSSPTIGSPGPSHAHAHCLRPADRLKEQAGSPRGHPAAQRRGAAQGSVRSKVTDMPGARWVRLLDGVAEFQAQGAIALARLRLADHPVLRASAGPASLAGRGRVTDPAADTCRRPRRRTARTRSSQTDGATSFGRIRSTGRPMPYPDSLGGQEDGRELQLIWRRHRVEVQAASPVVDRDELPAGALNGRPPRRWATIFPPSRDDL